MTAVRPPRPRSSSTPTRSAPKLFPIPRGLKLAPPKAPVGTVYRGSEGMWSWVLHRITGVAIFFFLLVHILDQALVRISPAAYDGVIAQYKNPIMGLGELALVAAIGLHALNGLRIVLIDFWNVGTRYHRLMFWTAIGLWAVLMIGFAPRHLAVLIRELPH